MHQIYIFSGLGADDRAFQNLVFDGYKVTFVKWLAPDKSENIAAYTTRLSQQIVFPDSVFIGLSFGGMMAVEVAKIIQPKQLILVASAQLRSQIPIYYRWAGFLKLHKLIPTTILKKPSFITNWFLVYQQKKISNSLQLYFGIQIKNF